jgi:hypothetical protein
VFFRGQKKSFLDMKKRSAWMFALVPTIVVLLFALYPQITLWRSVGSEWAGSYSAANYDEVAYSAYVNGLINGKPRKYDPMMGVEHDHESIYSLQLIPAYSVAIPARTLGITASTAFIILHILIAIFSSLALYYFLSRITEDQIVSAAGVLIILGLGTAVTLEGAFGEMITGGLVIEYHPFLRRYQPGFGFPIFFVLCAAVWSAFTFEGARQRYAAIASGLIFAVLVFSYFYLWTTAAAWLAVLFVIALVAMPEKRRQTLSIGITVAIFAVAVLVPYLLMLNQRSRKSDAAQLLTLTHAPELFAPTIIVGLVTVAALLLLAFWGRIDGRSPAAIFAYAFALTPLVVLNQQVITGRSLQPVHYEIFIANYCVLVGVVIALWLSLKGAKVELERFGMLQKVFVVLGIIGCIWGAFEAHHGVAKNTGMVAAREAVMPAANYIRDDSIGATESPAVFSPNPIVASFIPTVATVRILWSPHLVSAGVVDEEENKQQFYRYLYYSGFNAANLQNALDTRWFEVTAAIFGGGRALPQLGGANHPITDPEITEEVAKYQAFIDNINGETAYSPTISYVVVHAGDEPNFANIDRWYTRDGGQIIGFFKVYKLTKKPTA